MYKKYVIWCTIKFVWFVFNWTCLDLKKSPSDIRKVQNKAHIEYKIKVNEYKNTFFHFA